VAGTGAARREAVSDRLAPAVEQTIRIAARPETVWRFWTDPERLCEWWGGVAELEPTAGGRCHVDLGEARMRGEFVELTPHERLVFTFGWEPNDRFPDLPPGSSRVEVTLTYDGTHTTLTLRHTGLPPTGTADHDDGWAHFLPRLAATAAEAG
jgi:uncharacterized protein YndB with AHSA1/START domain